MTMKSSSIHALIIMFIVIKFIGVLSVGQFVSKRMVNLMINTSNDLY